MGVVTWCDFLGGRSHRVAGITKCCMSCRVRMLKFESSPYSSMYRDAQGTLIPEAEHLHSMLLLLTLTLMLHSNLTVFSFQALFVGLQIYLLLLYLQFHHALSEFGHLLSMFISCEADKDLSLSFVFIGKGILMWPFPLFFCDIVGWDKGVDSLDWGVEIELDLDDSVFALVDVWSVLWCCDGWGGLGLCSWLLRDASVPNSLS